MFIFAGRPPLGLSSLDAAGRGAALLIRAGEEVLLVEHLVPTLELPHIHRLGDVFQGNAARPFEAEAGFYALGRLLAQENLAAAGVVAP